jgi:hypothetical protein
VRDSHQLLDFVKAMADVDRLRIVGILAQENAGQTEIAGHLNMPLRDAVNHLAFLEKVGIVTLSDKLYKLNTDALENLARAQLREKKPEYFPAPGLDEKSRKVLATCLNPDGTIKQLPPQPGKLKVILEYLIQAFTPGVDYAEKEVNTIIRRFHVDVAGLRRDLVDAGLLDRERDGSRYWRVAPMRHTQNTTAKNAKVAKEKNNSLSGLSELGGLKKGEGRQNE